MNKNKIIKYIVLILLILCISDIIYLTSFHLNSFNERFYSKEFRKYNIYGEFPDKDIDSINSELLLYLKDNKEDYSKELFNENEITHLEDVKVLVQRGYTFYYSISITAVLLFLILFLLDKKTFLRNLSIVLFFSGVFTLFFTITLLILVWLNFDGVFTVFHHIFFPKGGWLFASSDNIIKLYPSEFFYDMAKRIFISVIIYGNILIVAALSIFFSKK